MYFYSFCLLLTKTLNLLSLHSPYTKPLVVPSEVLLPSLLCLTTVGVESCKFVMTGEVG